MILFKSDHVIEFVVIRQIGFEDFTLSSQQTTTTGRELMADKVSAKRGKSESLEVARYQGVGNGKGPVRFSHDTSRAGMVRSAEGHRAVRYMIGCHEVIGSHPIAFPTIYTNLRASNADALC